MEPVANDDKRYVRCRILIVCEGEKTEPNYFRSFSMIANSSGLVYEINTAGGGINTIQVVDKAIQLKAQADKVSNPYDSVWVVFDRDDFKPTDFDNAIKKATKNRIGCAWSNEAFELWYLLHFHNRVTAMSRDEYKHAIEAAVNEKIKNKKKPFKYKKNDPNMFNLLKEIGRQDLAIRWAKELNDKINGEKFAIYNPNTQVYKLVEELIGESEKLNTEIIEKYNKGE